MPVAWCKASERRQDRGARPGTLPSPLACATHNFPTIAKSYQTTVTVSRIIFPIIYLRKYGNMSYDSSRQAGTIEVYGDRGVWVPSGLSSRDIMEGAKVLVRDFDVSPYTARNMVRVVLLAIGGPSNPPANDDSGTDQSHAPAPSADD